VLWEFETEGMVLSAPALDGTGAVVAGSLDSRLYAVDEALGAERWRFTPGGPLWGSPAIATGGAI
jgi:outer membrane protein assembly factor BamB